LADLAAADVHLQALSPHCKTLPIPQQATITATANWLLKAARALLGEEHAAIVAGETALAAARKALELLSLGLIGAGLKQPDPSPWTFRPLPLIFH
jgi:hypothetical protein